MKRFLSAILTIVMVIMLIPSNVNAAGNWTKNEYLNWTLTDEQGTNVNVKIVDRVMYVKGTGAIPSFNKDALGARPWNGQVVYQIVIEKGITSIGANAFNGMSWVHQVDMYSGTYIEDPSAFFGFDEDAIFYIKGMDITSRDIGKIPYNSLDSYAVLMKQYAPNYRYVVDNMYVVGMIKNGMDPEGVNIAPSDALTKASNENFPLINLKSEVKCISNDHITCEAKLRRQGVLAYQVFDAFIGDYNYIGAYNIDVKWYGTMLRQSTVPHKFTMTIPNAYKFQGREFQLLQIVPGACNILADEDMSGDTITFTTDYPTATYALVYKDTFAGLLPQAQ